MRTSKILKKLRAGEVARICCLYSPMNMYARHAANAGFDGIWLDNEHNIWDNRELQRMIALHHLADIDCVVRPAVLGKTQLYQLLETGATGVLVPHVSTRAAAEFLVDALKFPPIGHRGLDGASIDNDFFLQGAQQYPAAANRETLVAVQIETAEALENVDEIASVPGVDLLFIGPGDLALRLGVPLDWTDPKMQAAQQKVAAAAARHGIHWGRPSGSVEDMKRLIRAGARFIAHGSDFESVMFSMQQRYRKVFEQALADETSDNAPPLPSAAGTAKAY